MQPEAKAEFWKSSGAVLHETEVNRGENGGAERDGGQYGDRRRGVELRRMENAYGRVSFLHSPGGKVGVEVARKSAYQEEQLPVTSGKLNEDRTTRMTMGSAHGYVDSHDQESSAFRLEERATAAPERIMSQLRRLSVELNQQTVQDMMPEAGLEQRVHGHSAFFGKMEAGIRTSVEEIRAKKGGTGEARELEESRMAAQEQAAESWIHRLKRMGGMQTEDAGDAEDMEDTGENGASEGVEDSRDAKDSND